MVTLQKKTPRQEVLKTSCGYGVSSSSLVEESTQTGLTSDLVGTFHSEFSTTPANTAFADTTSDHYSDAVNSDDELFHSDSGLDETYAMPDFVAIKFSERTRILLKDAKKTTTIKIDSKNFANDDIKLSVSDWPIGKFNLSIAGFEVYPKRSHDLPKSVTVSTERRKFLRNEDLLYSDAASVDVNQRSIWEAEKRLQLNSSKMPYDSNRVSDRINTSLYLKNLDSDKKHLRLFETANWTVGNRIPSSLDCQDRKIILENKEDWIKDIKTSKFGHGCEDGKTNHLNFQKLDNISGNEDSTITDIKTEKKVANIEVQTLVQISPTSTTDDKSDLTENASMLASDILEKSENHSNESHTVVETFKSKDDTEGLMVSSNNTDLTLKDISEIPDCSIHAHGTEHSVLTEEEMSDLSDKEEQFQLEGKELKESETILQSLPCESAMVKSTQKEEHFLNVAGSRPPIIKQNIFREDGLLKNEDSSNGSIEILAENKLINVSQNQNIITSTETSPEEVPMSKSNAPLSSNLMKINQQTISALDGSSLYESYSQAKSRLLKTLEALEKEMSPLRSELNRLQYEFQSMNVDNNMFSGQMESPTILFNSFPKNSQFLQYPGLYAFERGSESLPVFSQRIEFSSCAEVNCIDHSDTPSQLKCHTTNHNELRNSTNLFQNPPNKRSPDFRQRSVLSDPDDILGILPPE